MGNSASIVIFFHSTIGNCDLVFYPKWTRFELDLDFIRHTLYCNQDLWKPNEKCGLY